MLRREVVAGVLQLERAGNRGSEVMFRKAAARQQRLGIGERPTPTIEADHALKHADRFASHRLVVEAGLAESFESVPAASALSLGCHKAKNTTLARNPQLLGIAGPAVSGSNLCPGPRPRFGEESP